MVDLEATLRSSLDGRYAIEGEVGRGGMSVVFRARDLKHNRTVAIKVLKPELSEQVGADRFQREVEFAANLTNPHILPLFDSGEAAGQLYYVMPCIEGGTLKDRLERDGQLDIEDALAIARNVASALEAAHRHGIVHRDIKPANILFSGGEAMVADFGIARAVTLEDADRLTQSGLSVGSPAFMSPEQAGGDPVDGRSDLYSLGCVLYTMLTGEPPFVRPTAQATITAQMADPPPSVRTVRPEVPKGVDEIILTTLQKSRSDRFATATELIAALDHPELMPKQAKQRRRRRRLRLGEITLAVVVGVVGISYLAWRAYAPEPLPPADPNRIVVFPPHDLSATGAYREIAPGIAASIGYALEDTEPLKWLEGWDWMTPEQRRDPDLMTRDEMERITRELGAAYFIDGQTVVSSDSVTLIIRLHEVERPRTATRAGASAPIAQASLTPLGLRAIAQLIPVLVGGDVPPSSLQEHDVAGLANWGLGLSAYSRSRFEEAYGHFERALGIDSTLAVAAVDAALAAMWLTRISDAQRMAEIAVRHGSNLSARKRFYAEGVRHYTMGQAGPSILALARAVEVDSAHAEGWFALGEVFDQLIPQPEMLDSVADLLDDPPTHGVAAQRAYEKTRLRRPDFWPAIDRLARVELERGNVEGAREKLERYAEIEPDSSMIAYNLLILECLTGDPGRMRWDEEAARAPFDVLKAGLILGIGGESRECTDGALSAVLESDSAAANERWGALLTWQSVLVGQGRDDEVIDLLEASRGDLSGQYLYTMDAAAGARVEAQAEALERDIGTDHAGQPSAMVWVAGIRAAQQADSLKLARIVAEFGRRVAADSARQDLLFADVYRAHLSLSRADTADAIRRFKALQPTGTRAQLRWGPWEVLSYEWLTLARVLAARGEYEEALRWANQLDHVHPVTYAAFRPASLEVRIEAARGLGRTALADSLARLEALRN